MSDIAGIVINTDVLPDEDGMYRHDVLSCTRLPNQAELFLHPDPRVAELEAVLRECREALVHCEGVFDEVRGYPITYDLTIEAIAKIDEVLLK